MLACISLCQLSVSVVLDDTFREWIEWITYHIQLPSVELEIVSFIRFFFWGFNFDCPGNATLDDKNCLVMSRLNWF